MKHKSLLPLLLLLLLLTGCVTSQKAQKPSLTKPVVTQQSPSVVIAPPAPPPPVTDNKNLEKITAESAFIETSFIAQNCDAVLEHTRILESLYPNNDLTKHPPIIQAAIYTCDAKAGLSDPNRLKLAISNLKTISLRYPFINEAWVHNTLANFYIALNDMPNALIEKKQARDLLLAQQQDISTLNIEILKLDPSQASASPQAAPTQLPSTTSNQTVDQIISSATQLINNDSPEQAISLLDTIPADQRTENSKRIRVEAVNNLVTNLRFKVRALFVRSTEQTGQVKKDSLSQCEQILKGIIQNYSDYQDMAAVQNNLKQLQRELNKN